MKFKAKHQGKWVAAKDDKIIADATSLNKFKVSFNGKKKELEITIIK